MNKTWVSILVFIILMVSSITRASPVPDTGQTKCYNATVEIPCPSPGQPFYGQDANCSTNSMSYSKLDVSGNDLPDSAASWVMVRDNVTGLIWEMKTNKDGKTDYSNPHDADNTYTWFDSNPATNGGYAGTPGNGTTTFSTKDFINALNDTHYGGYSDWRMPTIKELTNIVNLGIPSPEPTIDIGYFPNTVASDYWSSTTIAFNNIFAWYVDFSVGDTFGFYMDYGSYKYYSLHVRAVRGGQSESFGHYKDNGDGTVTDISTGLMWQQVGSTNSQVWEQALSYCEGLNLGGYTDWRLPTIKELRSLVDYSRYSPSINITYFLKNNVSSTYWSSTTNAKDLGSTLIMEFFLGDDDIYDKLKSRYVRAVRGGQSVVPTLPTPDIKANGQDGQITVSSGTPVSITASLAPGDQNGKLADWWIAESTPWGFYTLTASGWSPGINMLFQYPLVSVSPVEINNGTLPAGDYAFYFGVDMSPNGKLDSPLYYDFVQVHVTN